MQMQLIHKNMSVSDEFELKLKFHENFHTSRLMLIAFGQVFEKSSIPCYITL